MGKKLHHLSDNELILLARNASSTMTAEPSAFGTSPAELSDLELEINAFAADVSAQKFALASARSATSQKYATRRRLLARLRKRRDVAKAFGTSAAKLAATGIPVSSSRAPSTATFPSAMIDNSYRLRHTIHFRDAGSMEAKRKPRGVVGIEIFVKVGGDMPGGEKDCYFLGFDVRSPFTHEYDAKNVGQTAHYMLRWRMRDESLSAWGQTISATITG